MACAICSAVARRTSAHLGVVGGEPVGSENVTCLLAGPVVVTVGLTEHPRQRIHVSGVRHGGREARVLNQADSEVVRDVRDVQIS